MKPCNDQILKLDLLYLYETIHGISPHKGIKVPAINM